MQRSSLIEVNPLKSYHLNFVFMKISYPCLPIHFKMTQSVIEAGLIGPLVNLLQHAEFDIKKEAAWAISNATSGGTPDQIK